MNIGIDGNEANIENRVGVNKYAFEMLWGLKNINEKRESPHNLIVYLKNKPLNELPEESNFFKYKVISGGGLWILTKLMPHLFLNPEKLDVLFSPSHYTVPVSHIRRVCSIMDLNYLENSESFEKKVFWQLKYWSAISIFVSRMVLTISEASKKDIVRHYPSSAKKIKVTLLGYDNDKFNLKVNDNLVRRIRNKYHIVDDYILFVSTLKPSKNIEGLITAFSRVSENFPKVSLVIAGKKGWMFEKIYQLVKNLKLENKIIFTDYFPEEERPALMKGSLFYVLPSFWEGFGIEILSAFGCGKPVVVSNIGSIPEVAGKAGIYVDPYSIDSIVLGLEKVLKMNKEEYNKQVKLGYEQARKFSWEKCSEETLMVLEMVAGSK